MADEDDDHQPAPYRALIGLLGIIGLVVVVLFVMHELQRSAKLEDCLASGRTNCVQIDSHPPR